MRTFQREDSLNGPQARGQGQLDITMSELDTLPSGFLFADTAMNSGKACLGSGTASVAALFFGDASAIADAHIST